MGRTVRRRFVNKLAGGAIDSPIPPSEFAALPYYRTPMKNMTKDTCFAPAFVFLALAGFGDAARAATLETYFDFTRYGSVAPGAGIVSNVHGNTPAMLKPAGATLDQWGLTVGMEQSAADTGVLIPAEALAGYTGDFSLQVWFITPVAVCPDTMIYGGTTSERGDDSMVGDQALFVGYNNDKGSVSFLRPVVGNGNRWGAWMDSVAGTGASLLSPQDYVITYNSARRVITAYLNGVHVGVMDATGFKGLAALSKGFAIGGVQNSAFPVDGAAPVNIRSFMIYSGVLSPGEVAKVHQGGPSVTLDALRAAEVEVK